MEPNKIIGDKTMFQESKDKLVERFKISETHAGCFLSNYGDRYICKEHNGGCAYQSECDKIHRKRKGKR
jgi:hypothetical protein